MARLCSPILLKIAVGWWSPPANTQSEVFFFPSLALALLTRTVISLIGKIKSIQLLATISTTYALKRVQPYFVAAIVGTILFPAVGIFAIINSVKAKYAKLDEDFDDTIKFSRYSYIFGRLAIFLGLTFYTAIVLVCLYLVGLWSFGTGAIFDKNRLKSLIKTLIFEPIKDRPPAEWFSAAHSICNFTREAWRRWNEAEEA